MANTLVGSHMERCNRNVLTLNTALLAAVTAVALSRLDYWYNFFCGPFPLTFEEVQHLTPADLEGPKKYFVVEGTDSVERLPGMKRDTHTHLLMSGNKGIFYNGATVNNLQVKGTLAPLDDCAKQQSRGYFFQPLAYKIETGYRAEGFAMLPLLGLAAAFAVRNLMLVARRKRQPELHPIIDELNQLGVAAIISARIEEELFYEPVFYCGPFLIARSYIIGATTFGLQVVPLSDIVWAYRRLNYLSVHTRLHSEHRFSGAVAELEAGLRELLGRSPQLVVGYNSKWYWQWEQDPHGFAYAIDEHRCLTLV